MDVLPESEQLAAAIRNAAWHVRAWRRPHQRTQRAAAIAQLGHLCRSAFNATDDFETLLAAIVDGLAPDERAPF